MNKKKVPVIHQTDLFHPHADPDDHWDAACQFALAYSEDIDLRGILMDYPLVDSYKGDPSIQAVNQMNYLTGQSVRIGVGLPKKAECAADVDAMLAGGKGLSGVNMVLDILEKSGEPVVIHIVGSCRDIVAAARRSPELFREKCKAIYLNAGASMPDSPAEYNVWLDPYTYSQVFAIPCPVYWMPCFDMADPAIGYSVGEYGTYYTFMQGDILPHLSPSMKNFFMYALSRTADNRWLESLNYPVNEAQMAQFSELGRGMWCTGGFLHTVGKTVLRSGKIAMIGECPDEEVFRFEPISITCSDEGHTDWKLDSNATDRYIFRVLDIDAYPAAMTTAMKEMLIKMP